MKHCCGLILVMLAFLSCGGQTARRQGGGDSVEFRYATLPSIVDYDGYTVVTIDNPWKEGKLLHTYVLVPREAPLPVHLPKGTVVRVPLQKAVVFTTVHSALLMALGCEDKIAGVADLKYIKIPWIHEQVDQGRIVDCGDGMSPVIEKIIDLHPDAILLSPFENSGGYGRLEDIGIPLVECAEYMEVSPLARAEWMRFYGLLFGVEQRTDSLFGVVDKQYRSLKGIAKSAKSRPSVMVDKMASSIWYVPGGKSTIGQMVQDAAGVYPWADDEHSGSMPMTFEVVLEKASEADLWLFRYSAGHAITYEELLKEYHGYDQFKAFRDREAFGCDVENSLFYEESPFRPDLLLNDFIRIFHPEISGLAPLRYYHRLSE